MRKVSKEYEKYLVDGAMKINEQDAWSVDSVVYLPPSLVRMPIPIQTTKESAYERKDGNLTVRVSNTFGEPLVSGSLPRFILYKLVTQSKLNKTKKVFIDNSINKFLRTLEMRSTGRRTINVQKALKGLMNCTISQRRIEGDYEEILNWNISEKQKYWWEGNADDNLLESRSYIEFSDSFYTEIKGSIPIDFRALKLLSRSPMAMDIYCWLTWRLYRLKDKPHAWIRVDELFYQFSHGFADNVKGLNNFQTSFRNNLDKVLIVFPQAQAKLIRGRLRLIKSPPHVRQKETVDNM